MDGSIQPLACRTTWGRWLAIGAVAALVVGCSRQQFRERADKDVEGVISQKNVFPDWKVENWHVYPDPRARFADAPDSHPDFPPYPPDDYAAWVTSPNPQHPGRGGAGRYEGTGYLDCIAAWDAQNRAEDAAEEQREKELLKGTADPKAAGADPKADGAPKTSPDPTAKGDSPGPELAAVAGGAASYLRVFASQDRPFRIRLDQAVELALFNSREFQDRREDLFLSALPVTLERFSFAAQAFASEQIIRESIGRDVPGGGGEFWRINTDVGVTRRFATGAELLVRLANQIVIDLSGPSPQTSISNLSLTFIQPLLRGGGYAVTLEALTQAERTLLYAIRSFARFRKVFYVALTGIVAAGGAGGGGADYTNNPYGLQGLSTNLGRGIGANLTARATGYLPTILRAATLANERKNVSALENFLLLFQNLKEGGGVTDLQVAQVELDLLESRNTVLTLERGYLDNIDFYKQQLGVPATLALELDDGPLRPIRRHVQRFDELYAQLRELEQAIGRYDPKAPPGQFRQRAVRLLTESSLARGTTFSQQYPKIAEELRRLSDDALAGQLANLLAQRRKLLDARADRLLKGQPESPEQTAEVAAVENRIDLLRFEQALRRYEAQPWRGQPAERAATEQANLFSTAFQGGFLVALQVRNERLEKLRTEWPDLAPLTVDGTDLLAVPYDEATAKVAQAALVNRLDLMNARAQVVDAWRQVTVAANALQGVFNVRYDLNTTTPRDEAATFGFAGTRTSHTVTLDLEPPFVRRAERNQYRATLIGYQRSRRNLMAFEDNIVTDARSNLRTLRQLAEQYRLQQRVVELAYAQVDNARSTLLAPPDPTSARGAAGEAAALTQQLLGAQRSLLQAQNGLYTAWLSYMSVRMNLYLDLELLPLDARGIWIDEPHHPHPADRPPGPDPGPPDPGVGQRLPDPKPEPAPAPPR
jgi:hypothetical protein